MRGLKIPSLLRNARDGSITLAYQQAKYSLIWLHGAGDSPDSYLPYFTHLQSPLYSNCRIRLLSAPNKLRSPTATHTPVWYDNEGDLDHIDASNKYLHQCFNEEMEVWRQSKQGNIPAHHRVYVGGMGQGASIALNYSYTTDPIPAGAIALSGSLLPQTELINLRKMPSLIMHGLKDESIKEITARRSYSQLIKVEYMVLYKAFDDLGHGVNLEELSKMKEWLQESHQFIKKHYETAAQ